MMIKPLFLTFIIYCGLPLSVVVSQGAAFNQVNMAFYNISVVTSIQPNPDTAQSFILQLCTIS